MNGELAVLRVLLLDDNVSSFVGTKVYLNEAPQRATLPYIILEERDSEPIDSKSGKAVTDFDIVGVFIYSNDQRQLFNISTAVRLALDDKEQGNYGSPLLIERISFMGQTGFFEKIENKKAFVKDQEYQLRVRLFGVTADWTSITADSTLITADNI
jgi:hypothetical protein